jgi:hypothetical protein
MRRYIKDVIVNMVFDMSEDSVETTEDLNALPRITEVLNVEDGSVVLFLA